MSTRAPTDPPSRPRAICLGLPEATETITWDAPVARVRTKIFAMHGLEAGRESVWCRAPVGAQEDRVRLDPKQFFSPPYVGPKGWIGVRLEGKPDWTLVAHLVERSCGLIAPKKLARMLELGQYKGTVAHAFSGVHPGPRLSGARLVA